jgi:hypothetical protein
VTTRNAVRGSVVGALLGLSLFAVATPAVALQVDDGAELGDSMSAMMTLLVFVVGPIALFLGIALVVALPSIMGGPRYRPGMGWRATPEWYGGPEEEKDTGPVGKVEPGHEKWAHAAPAGSAGSAEVAAPPRPAGATDAAASGRDDSAPESSDGGASARW